MPNIPTGTVTFLFSEIEGRSSFDEDDLKKMLPRLERQENIIRPILEAHSGYIFRKKTGTYWAAFSAVNAAVSAALTAQQALRNESANENELLVPMAIHTGSVEERENSFYPNSTIKRVIPLMNAGHSGQILLSFVAAELVRDLLPPEVTLLDLEEHRLKDLIHQEHIFQVVSPDIPTIFPPLKTLEVRPNNLPLQLTSFVGREQEMASVKRLLSSTRLLTLTGTGGAGKTRLALQSAAEVLEDYRNGVWLVELAPLSDSALVAKAIAAALGIREEPERPVITTLTEYLASRNLLLVLDNCEHLVATCAVLAETLLRVCPGLSILATSREALGIRGETDWLVPSLSLPDLHSSRGSTLNDQSDFVEYESIQLFGERAMAIQPSFILSKQNARTVAHICQRLDGIPLAIELAAARVRMFSVEQIAVRLDERFRLLTSGSRTVLPRQQTLRAAVDWSYELLSQGERDLLLSLSVFVSGWTLEAAEAVCGGEQIRTFEIWDLLTQLVNKSLVMAEEKGEEVRYRLLETIRHYAYEKMLETGELALIRRRYCKWFLTLAEVAEPQLWSSEQGLWIEKLERDFDNLRSALRWLEEDNQLEMALRLGSALWWFMAVRGHLNEGRQDLERLLARSEGIIPPVQAKALIAAGWSAYLQKDFNLAERQIGEGLTLFQQIGDKQNIALALYRLGLVEWARANYTNAYELGEQALALFSEVGDKGGIADSYLLQAYVASEQNEYGRARALSEQSLKLFKEVGDKWAIAYTLTLLAHVVLKQGDTMMAYAQVKESFEVALELNYKGGIASCMEEFASIAVAREQMVWAALLCGAAEMLREVIAIPLLGVEQKKYEQMVAFVRSRLGEETFAAAWAEGRMMTPEQVIAAEEQVSQHASISPPPRSNSSTGLTSREVEVLRLVSQGLTDAQVAEKLVLSPRTISTHLRSIYSKLGVTSRSAATRYALENHLV